MQEAARITGLKKNNQRSYKPKKKLISMTQILGNLKKAQDLTHYVMWQKLKYPFETLNGMI